jgi:hypothetical protein
MIQPVRSNILVTLLKTELLQFREAIQFVICKILNDAVSMTNIGLNGVMVGTPASYSQSRRVDSLSKTSFDVSGLCIQSLHANTWIIL